MTWYTNTIGTPTHAMAVIQNSVPSAATVFAMVRAGPTLLALAATKYGNIDVASRNTTIMAVADCVMKASKSSL